MDVEVMRFFTRRFPPSIVARIAQEVLADDVVDYISCRVVCHEWRTSLRAPSGFAPRFRPRRWVMLTDGDANLSSVDLQRFLNLTTGRSLLLRLPPLLTYSVVSDCEGLLVLVRNDSLRRPHEAYSMAIYNPFTCHLVDIPSLKKLRILQLMAGRLDSTCMWTCSFGCAISDHDTPTVVLYTRYLKVLFFAKVGDATWKSLELTVHPSSVLYFNTRFYVANPAQGLLTVRLEERRFESVAAPLPPFTMDSDQYFLTDYNGEMLLIVHRRSPNRAFRVLNASTQPMMAVPHPKLLEIAIFLGYKGRSLAVSLNGLPSLRGGSIYCCTGQPTQPLLRFQSNNSPEQQPEPVSSTGTIHDSEQLVLPSIRPFNLAEHLATYCSPLQWSLGLMYHEFAQVPYEWIMDDNLWATFKGKYRTARAQYRNREKEREEREAMP